MIGDCRQFAQRPKTIIIVVQTVLIVVGSGRRETTFHSNVTWDGLPKLIRNVRSLLGNGKRFRNKMSSQAPEICLTLKKTSNTKKRSWSENGTYFGKASQYTGLNNVVGAFEKFGLRDQISKTSRNRKSHPAK